MKYLLQKSNDNPEWWVVTDTENGVVCRFKEGAFNETQKFTPLNDMDFDAMFRLAGIVREMSDWLAENHRNLLF